MTFKMPIADALKVMENYWSAEDENSLVKGVPIQYLESFIQVIRDEDFGRNCRIRVRYRGPRNHHSDTRPASLRQSVCLKQFATTFALYIDI